MFLKSIIESEITILYNLVVKNNDNTDTNLSDMIHHLFSVTESEVLSSSMHKLQSLAALYLLEPLCHSVQIELNKLAESYNGACSSEVTSQTILTPEQRANNLAYLTTQKENLSNDKDLVYKTLLSAVHYLENQTVNYLENKYDSIKTNVEYFAHEKLLIPNEYIKLAEECFGIEKPIQ